MGITHILDGISLFKNGHKMHVVDTVLAMALRYGPLSLYISYVIPSFAIMCEVVSAEA